MGWDGAIDRIEYYRDTLEDSGKDFEDQDVVTQGVGFLHDEKDAAAVVQASWQHPKDRYGRWYHARMSESATGYHDAYDDSATFADSPAKMIANVERCEESFGEDVQFNLLTMSPGTDYEELER